MLFRQNPERTLRKEWEALARREQALAKQALREKESAWKRKLEEKVPAKAYGALESAFCKAFAIVFEKGTGVIEKTYRREEIQKDHAVRDYAVQLKGNRRAFRQLRGASGLGQMKNMAITTVEGVGLGVVGVGLPDIVLFVGMLLKGVYETALRYGFDYESPQERMLILKILETSLTKGELWQEKNREIDFALAGRLPEASPEALEEQIRRTAQVFAMDMLVLKFVQGLPVVGVLGGAGNPVYYNRVMKYVSLQYEKRYLHKLQGGG